MLVLRPNAYSMYVEDWGRLRVAAKAKSKVGPEKPRGVHRTLTPRSQTLFHRLGTIPVEWE